MLLPGLVCNPAVAAQPNTEDLVVPQFINIMPVYVDSDDQRGADEGRGFRIGYGRAMDARWYWETDLFGGVLETGNANITDLYQLGVSTGLSWSLYNRDPSHWTPYLICMLGAVYNDGQPDSRDGTDLTLAAGVGAVSKSLFDNGIRLRAEARYLYDTYASD
jgi:OOP family OmpA-OmpF porin